MDTLHIDNGYKKIEANDKGECIEFSIVSNGFFKAFSELVQWVDAQEQVLRNLAEQQKKVFPGDSGEINYDALDSVLDIRGKVSKEACEKIDSIFGADASRKIFCGIEPDCLAIVDFIGQVSPLIEGDAKERNQTIGKRYSKTRKGAKS